MHSEDDLIWREIHFPDEKKVFSHQGNGGSTYSSGGYIGTSAGTRSVNSQDDFPDSEEETVTKIREVDANLWGSLARAGRKISFKRDIVALYRYMKDNDVPWFRKGIVVMALLYFILPIDTIPDITPVLGYLDDLGVITATIRYLGNELTDYYE